MARRRILIVTHAALSPEHGAAQIALNLGAALRSLGHEVMVWSPQPLPANGRWLRGLQAMRAKLRRFVADQPAFDIVDAPASLVTGRLRRNTMVVVRSVQPDLRYLGIGMLEGLRFSPRDLLRLMDRLLQLAYHGYLVLQGWRRADLIVCMGRLELEWMRRFFPWWTAKLRSYVVALSEEDQARLRKVRANRAKLDASQGLRFLWMGRWARHKGNGRLEEFARKWLVLRPQDRITIAGCGTGVLPTIPHHLLDSFRVRIVPTFTRAELPALLSAHDAGLFTSTAEGWGLSLNEMLESGMPVYATDAGGVADLAAHAPGQLRPFPPQPADLGPVDPNARDWAGYYTMFSWGAIAKRYVETVDGALPRSENK